MFVWKLQKTENKVEKFAGHCNDLKCGYYSNVDMCYIIFHFYFRKRCRKLLSTVKGIVFTVCVPGAQSELGGAAFMPCALSPANTLENDFEIEKVQLCDIPSIIVLSYYSVLQDFSIIFWQFFFTIDTLLCHPLLNWFECLNLVLFGEYLHSYTQV